MFSAVFMYMIGNLSAIEPLVGEIREVWQTHWPEVNLQTMSDCLDHLFSYIEIPQEIVELVQAQWSHFRDMIHSILSMILSLRNF